MYPKNIYPYRVTFYSKAHSTEPHIHYYQSFEEAQEEIKHHQTEADAKIELLHKGTEFCSHFTETNDSIFPEGLYIQEMYQFSVDIYNRNFFIKVPDPITLIPIIKWMSCTYSKKAINPNLAITTSQLSIYELDVNGKIVGMPLITAFPVDLGIGISISEILESHIYKYWELHTQPIKIIKEYYDKIKKQSSTDIDIKK